LLLFRSTTPPALASILALDVNPFFLFVIQAVSYEYRSKAGNLLGKRTYENLPVF